MEIFSECTTGRRVDVSGWLLFDLKLYDKSFRGQWTLSMVEETRLGTRLYVTQRTLLLHGVHHP